MNPTTGPRVKPDASLDAIDQILDADDTLVPTSGFLSSVMERVREEAAVPAPIPFPWKRAVPGLLFILAVLGWLTFKAVRYSLSAPSQLSLASSRLTISAEQALAPAGVVALSLALSLVCWLLSSRMVRRSSLL